MNGHTAAHHVWCTCAVASYCDSISSDDSELNGSCVGRVWKSIEDEHVTNDSAPSTPFSRNAPPSRVKSKMLEATDSPTELDDIVVDSIILERSADEPSLGTWDLSNWQTLEFTMSNLLVMRE